MDDDDDDDELTKGDTSQGWIIFNFQTVGKVEHAATTERRQSYKLPRMSICGNLTPD